MAKVEAPFTDEQVIKLTQWQSGSIKRKEAINIVDDELNTLFPDGMVPVHPFTCCSHNDCKRGEREDQGILIPSNEGWVCPCGEWKQNWCHNFMVE